MCVKTVFTFSLEQSNPERVIPRLAERKLGDVRNIQEAFRRFNVRAGMNAYAIAQQLRRTYCAGREQKFFFVCVNMRVSEVARIVFLEHYATRAIEKSGSGFWKLTLFLSDLAEQSQGQGIFVDVLDPAASRDDPEHGSVSISWKFVRQEDVGIVIS